MSLGPVFFLIFSFSWLGQSGSVLASETTCVNDVCDGELDMSLMQVKLRSIAGGEAANVDHTPALVDDAFGQVAEEERAKLVMASLDGATQPPGADVFSAIGITMPLAPPVLRFDDRDEYEDGKKNIVGLSVLPKKPCVVYGIGVSPARSHMTSEFETEMAELGCECHAFDCAVSPDDPNVFQKPFAFHQWCIGRATKTSTGALDETLYTNANSTDDFKPLSQTMHELNHTHISLMKFDIEGFEWQLFEEELFAGTDLPDQLSFEVHTEGASKIWVPPENVQGKGYVQVNRLFLRLFDLGYRVASKQINGGDPHCAEFILVKL